MEDYTRKSNRDVESRGLDRPLLLPLTTLETATDGVTKSYSSTPAPSSLMSHTLRWRQEIDLLEISE